MPRADWKFLFQCRFLVPELQLLHSFRSVTKPILCQLRTLALSNRQLIQTRDLLLPRLMSGVVSV